MGYITTFELHIAPANYPTEVVGAALAKATGSDDIEYDIQYIEALRNGDVESKWYGHDEDMVALSKELPDVLFRLSGVGEEQGDEWVKFYLNGEIETHRRQNWNPPRMPNGDMRWTAEHRDRAKAAQAEHFEKIQAQRDAELEKRAIAKREAAAAEIQKLAEKAGVEVIVKGVGE